MRRLKSGLALAAFALALISIFLFGFLHLAEELVRLAAPLKASDVLILKDFLLSLSGPLSAFVSMIGAIVAGIALFVSMRNTNTQVESSNFNANAQRWRDANQKEIEQLEELLRIFHVPFLVRSQANNNMAQDLRNRLKDPDYRLLIKLFDSEWIKGLSVGDQTIVEEICRTGFKLHEFIEEHGGRTDTNLAEHLARASAHFRILFLAFEGKLGDDPTPFEKYVYPRQLDEALKIDRERILNRIKQLRAQPGVDHGIIEPLKLSSAEQLDLWPNPSRLDSKAWPQSKPAE